MKHSLQGGLKKASALIRWKRSNEEDRLKWLYDSTRRTSEAIRWTKKTTADQEPYKKKYQTKNDNTRSTRRRIRAIEDCTEAETKTKTALKLTTIEIGFDPTKSHEEQASIWYEEQPNLLRLTDKKKKTVTAPSRHSSNSNKSRWLIQEPMIDTMTPDANASDTTTTIYRQRHSKPIISSTYAKIFLCSLNWIFLCSLNCLTGPLTNNNRSPNKQ